MSVCGHLGFYNTSSTRTHVRLQFATFAASGSSVAPNSAYEAADIRIYRAADGAAFSATQRSSANGITMTSPFDSLVGFHDVDIDLTDNTDAGFYAAGYFYSVVLAADETVDSQTINGVVLCTFEIGVAPVNVTQFGGTAGTFSSGRPEVNASHISGSAISQSGGVANVNVSQISGDSTAADNAEAFFDGTGYAGTNNVIPTVTTVTNRVTADVDRVDGVALDTHDAGAFPADVRLFGGTAGTFSGGRPEVNTTHAAGTAWGSGAITADSIASDAITAAKIANGAIDAATFAADVDAEILSYIVDDATRVDASALNTLSSHDPGETIMGATDLGTGAGLTSLASAANLSALSTTVGVAGAGLTEAGGDGDHLTAINLPNQTMDIVGNITGNLSGSVGSVTAGVTLANDAITAAKFDESTAFPLTSADTGATAVARTGADSDTLETLSDQMDGIAADLPQRITKNTALAAFPFTMVDDGDHVTGATGLTVTATRSLDGGAFGACANSVSEIGNGVYKIDLAAGDLNGNTVVLKFTATGADARLIHIVTQPT